ncbi:MAG: class I SAM-dependent methyltransferase [Aggregatilineales bacterium]
MTIKAGTDRETLTQKAYASDAALAVRQRTHDLYSVPKIDFAAWVLGRGMWRGDERVLDVGTGPGLYFEPLLARIPHGQLIGGDLSLGMARRAAEHRLAAQIGIFNGDVQTLPFADETFDAALANHMLYHVPDVDAAVAELRRVLKPDGVLIAATNSEYNMAEFDQLIARACVTLRVSRAEIEKTSQAMHESMGGFKLENGGSLLARHFFAVERCDLPAALVFQTPQPVLDYVNSMRALREPYLPPSVTWETLMKALTDWLQQRMGPSNYLAVSKLSGVLIATNSGGFAREYVARLRGDITPTPTAAD